MWPLLAACGAAPALTPADPNVTPASPPLPMARVFVLESWGAPAEDTTVRFNASEARTILLRRGSPDNGVFALLSFPAGTVQPASGDSATIVIRPGPGLFTLELATEAAIGPGAELTFSYGIHFVSPGGARAAYGSDIRFERHLAVSRLQTDSIVAFLDSWRTASDMLTARINGPGLYLVAAPRTPPRFRSIVW